MAVKAKAPAKYSLTKEEKEHLSAIQGMMGYLTQVVRSDMSKYVDLVIKKRLLIPDDNHIVVDIEKGSITLENIAPEETKPEDGIEKAN